MNKLIIDQHELNCLVNKICRDIVINDWRPDYIVGLSRGGLIPAVMISHYLNIPMRPLEVSLRDGGQCVSDLGMAEDAFGHENLKNILIVDDINDTGSTFNWIMKDWPSGCFPDDPTWGEVWNDNVRFAVIVDNLASKCEAPMDYVGKEINKAENDVWVDFPWEDWWAK